MIPRRHVATWFDATPDERAALVRLLDAARAWLDERHRPDRYNIGGAAGPTIAHLHLHLIPRYRGDRANRRGGVRGVMPERQWYPSEGEAP